MDDCQKHEKAALADQLYKISQFTWKELRQNNRHGLGYEKVSRDSLNVPAPEWITPDVHLIAFRFSGKAPMIGFRDAGGVFHILWLDRGFKVYHHG